MTHWRTFHRGRYMNALQLNGDCTFTIGRIVGTDIERPDGSVKINSMVIHWKEDGVLPWVTSVTACRCLEAMYGDQIEGWIGKPVTIYNDKSVRVMGKQVGGIRVRGAPGIKPTRVEVKMPRRKRPDIINLVDTARRQ